MPQNLPLVVELFDCCLHLLQDRSILSTLWLTLEVGVSPNGLDLPDNDTQSPVNYEDVTLPGHQVCRQCLDAGQPGSRGNKKRVGAVIQVPPEQQLGDHHHGLLEVVRQCFQTLQGGQLGLVVLDIILLVSGLLQTWGVAGKQVSRNPRGCWGRRRGRATAWSWWRGWLHDNGVFTLIAVDSVVLTMEEERWKEIRFLETVGIDPLDEGQPHSFGLWGGSGNWINSCLQCTSAWTGSCLQWTRGWVNGCL